MAKGDVLIRLKADTKSYDQNIAKARRQLDSFVKDNMSVGGVMKQTSSALLSTAARFASVTAAVSAVGSAISSNIETAKNFEKSMSQLSSLTGMVGSDLDKLKEYAIELGASTTLSASQVADAFRMIGSQQPQLLESGEALKAVTKNAITLAEAAGIDLATASQTLSTSINQMGGDSSNAERYINVLAAASQKGAGDIAWLGEAITKSATAAKAVGTDYEELVANLEQLAKAGFDASTAGTALRSIIMNLEKQANSEFKPSIVGLTQAFENLGKANLDLSGYQEIAGKMFASQAMALANAADEARRMKEEITGTSIAEDQAKTNTDNLDGSLKSLASAWEGLNLHINSSNGLLRVTVDWLTEVVKWADEAVQSYSKIPGIKPKEGIDNLAGDNVDDNGNYKREYKQNPSATPTPPPPPSPTTTTPHPTIHTPRPQSSPIDAGDFQTFIGKSILGASSLKGSDVKDMPSVYGMMSPDDIKAMTDEWSQYGKTFAESMGFQSEAFDNLKEWSTDFDPVLQKMQEMEEHTKSLIKSANITADVVGSIGQAFSAIDDPAAKVAGTVMQAVASVALGYAKALTHAEEVGGPWGWVAFAATGLATMLTTISAIHSATGYANGGRVEGNSYSGDNIPIMANAGEIVLNQAQQSNVAAGLQGAAGAMGNMRLRSEVRGSNLVLVIDRALKEQGSELAVWGR